MQKIEDVILFQIDLTSKVAKRYSQKEFDQKKLGITVDQWVLLKIVHEYQALTQKELADRSYRDPASITRTLDLLEKKNLLRRKNISDNRRSYEIELTTKGSDFVDKHLDLIKSHRKNSIKGISKKDLILLSSILEKMRKNML